MTQKQLAVQHPECHKTCLVAFVWPGKPQALCRSVGNAAKKERHITRLCAKKEITFYSQHSYPWMLRNLLPTNTTIRHYNTPQRECSCHTLPPNHCTRKRLNREACQLPETACNHSMQCCRLWCDISLQDCPSYFHIHMYFLLLKLKASSFVCVEY